MKENKKNVPLKEVCLDFVVPQRDKPTAFDGSIPWCRIEDIEGRYLNGSKSGQNVTKELADNMNMHLCPKGTVISACSASIGNQAITTTDCYTNQTFIGIVVNPDLLYNVYLYYFLESQTNNLLKLGQGATIKYISKDKYKRMLIPLPSLSEQQSIVDYLDSAFAKTDAMKANAEKALNEAKALFQASLKEMLEPKEGWEEKKLGDLGDLKNGMNFLHNESGYDIRILGVGDFGNKLQVDDPSELPMISLNKMPSDDYLLKDEDVIFVRSNGNKQLVGRSLVIYTNGIPTTFSGFCIRYRRKDDILDVRFLLYSLRLKRTREKLFGNGANISNLNQKILQDLFVSFPNLTEQQHIVSRLDSLSENVKKLEENLRKTISECDALKQALLRQVFE